MNFTREPMSLKEQVILSLKDFRKNKNISQSQLADRIGVSRDTIARLESGRARMYLELVEKIAHELNVKILELSDKVEQLETDTETKSRFYNNYKINYLNYPNAYPQPIKSSPTSEVFPNDGEDTQRGDGDFIYHSEKPARQLLGRGGYQTTTRNPYLDEKAVFSYGEPMKKYILEHRLFWHWVPLDDLPGLSISSVVEATLNQGKEEDIKWLFDTISTVKVADIFRRQITGARHGYSDMMKNYFEAYFNRHAPKI